VLQGGIVVVVLAIAAVVALVLVNSVRPPSPGPHNMLSDGIKIGQGFTAVSTAALKPEATPVPNKKNAADVIDIKIYVDYQCPVCGVFESTNAAQLKKWVAKGAATVEIHPIAILDNASLGTKYSTRSSNAAACVANYAPNSFFDFSALLFVNQPKENTEGLSDKRLIDLVKKSTKSHVAEITDCVANQTYKSWVSAATSRATSGPIPGSNVSKIAGTPTILINGKKYTGSLTSTVDFASAISTAAGATFSQDATPSPQPSAAN
jgi:protein-disulfide isomerase